MFGVVLNEGWYIVGQQHGNYFSEDGQEQKRVNGSPGYPGAGGSPPIDARDAQLPGGCSCVPVTLISGSPGAPPHRCLMCAHSLG